VSEGMISPHDAQELEACFRATASDLFGRACVVTRGDQALAHDLVQVAFEAAARSWQALGSLTGEQRPGWLYRTLANIAVNGFRREAAFRDRLPRIEILHRKILLDPEEQAFSPVMLERCWRVIGDLPERQHAAALLRWGLDMKEAEIAAALHIAEETVSSHLSRVRRQLFSDQTGTSPEDARLSRLYQQITDMQAPRFGADYDLDKGLERCHAWLREHTGHTEQTREWSPDLAVVELYTEHYRSLVRLAALLVRDTPTAEEVVQDSFIAMHGGWERLRDTEKALAYLRQAVVNRSRSVLRHRIVIDKNMQKPPPDMPSAEHGAFVLLERSEVVAALRSLPERQREAIVLRYYADLSEAEIATAMGISRGAVKSHTARGMSALRSALEER
jgi:RNA polymerase sigma-70 factor (sigma-E family)